MTQYNQNNQIIQRKTLIKTRKSLFYRLNRCKAQLRAVNNINSWNEQDKEIVSTFLQGEITKIKSSL